MIRSSAVLIALLLAFAAAPLRAQEAVPSLAAASAAPLPAMLQPNASTSLGLHATPMDDALDGAAIGMGVGCALFGLLAFMREESNSGSRRTDTLLGCAFGTFMGGVFGFTFAGLKAVSRRAGAE